MSFISSILALALIISGVAGFNFIPLVAASLDASTKCFSDFLIAFVIEPNLPPDTTFNNLSTGLTYKPPIVTKEPAVAIEFLARVFTSLVLNEANSGSNLSLISSNVSILGFKPST